MKCPGEVLFSIGAVAGRPRLPWPALLVAGLALCCDKAHTDPTADAGPALVALASSTKPKPVSADRHASMAALPSFADLAARANPAVVFVKTAQGETGLAQASEGWGSAFIFDDSGLVLTNYHVIRGARSIKVILENERQLTAEVLGVDPPTDVALLKVSAGGLAHLELGDSDALRVGDWVVAIGNPFGLSHTVSLGILSAMGRTGREVKGLDASGYYNFLQTDASINPGNSGGPLLDAKGRVVGMNTAINAQANDIGFAIPINMIKELLPSLLKDGKVKRSAVGMSVVAPSKAAGNSAAHRAGAIVHEVFAGGPAEKAGLKVNDLVVAFQGQPVSGPERLRWLASLVGVGKLAKLRILRGSESLELTVRMGVLPEQGEPR